MSNLGMYQKMTTYSKKVGGPVNLFSIIACTSVAIGSITTLSVQKIIKNRNNKKIDSTIIYTIIKSGKSNEGICFNIGDNFKVLEKNNDAILIEILGKDKNPYFVSYELLKALSNLNL